MRVVNHPHHRERAPHDVPRGDGRREDDPAEEEHQARLHVADHLERHGRESPDAQERRDVHEHREEARDGEEGQRRGASEELLRSTLRDFPPAYIEDTGKEELRSDDVDVVIGETGLDSATAKLCV